MEDLELQATVATVVVIVSTPAFTIKNQQQSTVSEVARPNQPPLLNGTLCVSHFRAQHPQCCPSFIGVVMPQLCRAMAQMTAIWRTRKTKRGLIQRKLGEIWMTILHLHMESLAGATE